MFFTFTIIVFDRVLQSLPIASSSPYSCVYWLYTCRNDKHFIFSSPDPATSHSALRLTLTDVM